MYEIHNPVNKPNAAAKKVFIKINGTTSSIAPLLPPLKPNQPNHKISVPKTAKGKLEPVNLPLLASEYFPILGPKIITAAKAIHPPTECTIVLPAKSTKPKFESHPVELVAFNNC